MRQVGLVHRASNADEILWDLESDRAPVADTWSVGEVEFLNELSREHTTEFILGDVSVAIQDRAYRAVRPRQYGYVQQRFNSSSEVGEHNNFSFVW